MPGRSINEARHTLSLSDTRAAISVGNATLCKTHLAVSFFCR